MFSLRFIVFVLLAILLFLPSFAASNWIFPGPPLTLDELWSKSTVVGLADVTSVKQVENEMRVSLSLKKSLKKPGEFDDSVTDLNLYTLLGGCPYPFDFQEGQQVLVFLEYDNDRKMYLPVGSAESAIEMDGETYALFAKRLLELPPILSLSDKSEKDSELLIWYVKCAETPEMRGVAAWGISSLRQRNRAKLTQSQKLQIVNILTNENPPTENAASLFAQISGFPDEKIDRYLLTSLRRSHEPGWSELTRSAIEHLPERLGISLEESTAKRLDEYWTAFSDVYYSVDDAELENDQQSADAQERLAILWGSISNEIYVQCKIAIEHRGR